MLESAIIRLETKRVDVHRQYDLHFRQKAHLDNQMEEVKNQQASNEITLHHLGGYLQSLDEQIVILLEEEKGPDMGPNAPEVLHSDIPDMNTSQIPQMSQAVQL